jgi:hypothetical protein
MDEWEDRHVNGSVEEFRGTCPFYCDEDCQIDAPFLRQNLRSARSASNLRSRTRGKIEQDARIQGVGVVHPRLSRSKQLGPRYLSLKLCCCVTEEEITDFIHHVEHFMKKVPSKWIVNLNATNWRSVSLGFLTYRRWDVETLRREVCALYDQEGITVIVTLDTAGNKLPLKIIGKGETLRCLVVMQLPQDVWMSFSLPTWTNSEVMSSYFGFLWTDMYPNGLLIVKCDTDSVHRTQVVRTAAKKYGIELFSFRLDALTTCSFLTWESLTCSKDTHVRSRDQWCYIIMT